MRATIDPDQWCSCPSQMGVAEHDAESRWPRAGVSGVCLGDLNDERHAAKAARQLFAWRCAMWQCRGETPGFTASMRMSCVLPGATSIVLSRCGSFRSAPSSAMGKKSCPWKWIGCAVIPIFVKRARSRWPSRSCSGLCEGCAFPFIVEKLKAFAVRSKRSADQGLHRRLRDGLPRIVWHTQSDLPGGFVNDNDVMGRQVFRLYATVKLQTMDDMESDDTRDLPSRYAGRSDCRAGQVLKMTNYPRKPK